MKLALTELMSVGLSARRKIHRSVSLKRSPMLSAPMYRNYFVSRLMEKSRSEWQRAESPR